MLNDKLTVIEEFKIFDNLAHQMKKGAVGPLGWVQIYLQSKNGLIFDEGPNLISAQGREFVAQKVFHSCATDVGYRDNWTDYVLSHFALGDGGTSISGTPPSIQLNGPYICDTSLISAVSLDGASYLTEPGPSQIPMCVKPIVSGGGSTHLVSYGYSGGGSTCTYYTKMKCTCIIPAGEPGNLSVGEAIKFDEAALYFVSGVDAKLFSHICFPPKWKEKESILTIQWYILF